MARLILYQFNNNQFLFNIKLLSIIDLLKYTPMFMISKRSINQNSFSNSNIFLIYYFYLASY